MTLFTHAVAVPADELHLVLIEIPDLDGGAPLRYAEGLTAETVTLEDASVATFPASGFEAEAEAVDDSATAQRSFTVPDIGGLLWSRIRANIGRRTPLRVIVRQYLSTDLSEPVSVTPLEMQRPSRDDESDAISFTAVSVDPINRDAGMSKFTYTNSPGLRGR